MEPCKSNIVPLTNSLNSLKANAFDGTSALELSKFDLKFYRSIAGASDHQSSSHNSKVSSPKLPTMHNSRVGEVNCSFSDSDIIQGRLNDNYSSRAFLGQNFRMTNYWSDRLINDPKFTTFNLECICDLRQAGHTDFEIQRALGLWGIPPAKILNDLLLAQKPSAAQMLCFNCLELGHFCSECVSKIRCHCCKNLGHMGRYCPKRCSCRSDIHVASMCPRRKIWREKLVSEPSMPNHKPAVSPSSSVWRWNKKETNHVVN
jgi:hypothetical protein